MASLIPVSDPRQTGLIFCFLAVRPKSGCKPDINVDYVRNGVGNLTSKLRAQNECLINKFGYESEAPARWKVLVGFYTHNSNWKRKIKPKWSQFETWEEYLLGGIRLACKYGIENIIYISSEAQSHPKSHLLCALQKMSDGADLKTKKDRQQFWKTILSSSFTSAHLHTNPLLKAF